MRVPEDYIMGTGKKSNSGGCGCVIVLVFIFLAIIYCIGDSTIPDSPLNKVSKEIFGKGPNLLIPIGISIGFVLLGFIIKIISKSYQSGSVPLIFISPKPLTKEEVSLLSNARKINYINSKFRLIHSPYSINVTYRESLSKNGRWDKINLSIEETGAMISELLKYKRHEWSVWILSDEQNCKLLWANKGDDNESCYFKGDYVDFTTLAKKYDCTTVIHFHNHPHTKERCWNLLHPSEQDLKMFDSLKDYLNDRNLNFIVGICSQGEFIVYNHSFSNVIYPRNCFTGEIQKENNQSKKHNRQLRKELRSKINDKISIK